MKSDNKQPSPDASKSKKNYQQPQLRVYGELRDITQSTGMKGANDGGKGFSKTQA